MSTIWSIITNRKDGLSKVWKEWRSKLISVSSGPADAGAIPMLNAAGKIDPSMVTGGGGGTTVVITLVAGQNISSFQVVAVHSDGLAYVASAGNIFDVSRVVGVAITSALIGNSVQVQQVGAVDNLGWSFVPGTTVYLGLGGALVQVPGAGVFELPLGVATSVSELEAQIGLPIILS